MGDEISQDDRRRSPRVTAETYASLEVEGLNTNDQGFGVVIDVSSSGIRVRTPQPPNKGQQVIVRVAVGEELFRMRANVARVTKASEGTWDVGLAYSSLDRLKVQFLEAFLAENPIS